MSRELVYYLVVILVMSGGLLLLERLVAGPHTTGSSGFARADSAFDFDRLRWRQRGSQAAARLLRHGRGGLVVLDAKVHEPLPRRDAGEQLILVRRVLGSVYAGSPLFDRDFRPVSDRARARLNNILVAMREGEPLPPIEVWACCGGYFVVDGHHRVAAARALGLDVISAQVVEVDGHGWWAGAPSPACDLAACG